MTTTEVSKMGSAARAAPDVTAGDTERSLATGRALLDQDRSQEAFEHFRRLAAAHPRSEPVLQGASRAWLAMARTATAPSGLDELRFLLDEPSGPFEAPVFHREIAALGSGRGAGQLRGVAEALTPLLELALDDPQAGKGIALLLLMLRQWALPRVDPARIAAVHRRWLPAFEYGDLKLIYNSMFPPTGCERNVEELLAFGCEDPRLRAGSAPYRPYLAVVHDWLRGGAGFGEAAAASKDRPTVAPDAAPADRAALRLLERHRALGQRAEGVDDAPSLIDRRGWQGVQYLRERVAARAPFVRRLTRKPRVAVCVSGQLRGYRSALKTWQALLLPAWDADVFVHSWTRVGRSSAEPFRSTLPFDAREFCKAYVEVCAQLGFDRVQQRYPHLFERLAAGGVASADDLAREYGTPHVHLDDDASEPFASLSNQQKMHLKIERCFDTALASGNEYELYVRLRPDKAIGAVAVDWNALARRCNAGAVLFADHPLGVHYGAPMIGDQMAVASRRVMEVYARAWSLYPPLGQAGLLACPPHFEGHQTLAMVSWLHGIRVRKVPVRFGTLQEAERMPAAEILEQVRRNAAGRDDATDRRLIDALASDLGAAW